MDELKFWIFLTTNTKFTYVLYSFGWYKSLGKAEPIKSQLPKNKKFLYVKGQD